ncbi:hypothetical protein [Bdellovibrio sp.]|uniref:hypothetical protein n=1 Tax=Bdellovibrio sp. TaxID=28201 RepID=UPI0039E22429
MKRSILASVLVGLSLVQNLAYANIITDLPNPWESDDAVSAGNTPSTVPPSAQSEEVPRAPESREVESKELRIGDRVYYANWVGTVKSFLPYDKVLLARDGYYDVAVEKSYLAKSVRCERSGRLCVNDQVIYATALGKVKEAFANGMILISRDGYYDSFVEERSLGKAVRCLKSLCSGDQVIYYNTAGTIKSLFDNRQVIIGREGYYDSVVDVGDLFKRTKCDSKGRICEGDKIVYYSSAGVVLRMYSNDKVVIQRSGYYDSVVEATEVAKAVNCLGDVCVGNRVFYYQSIGTVVGLFANKQVLLRRDGYHDSFVALEDVAKSVQCLPKHKICAGDKVSYYNSPGLVKEVFANGKVLVVRSGYYDGFLDVSDLKKLP